MIFLREKDRQRLLNLAHQHLKTEHELWVFGSRINGTAADMSDLDMVIRSSSLEPLPTSELYAFKSSIRHSNIPILVQIFDWGRLPLHFQNNILKSYEVLSRR